MFVADSGASPLRYNQLLGGHPTGVQGENKKWQIIKKKKSMKK